MDSSSEHRGPNVFAPRRNKTKLERSTSKRTARDEEEEEEEEEKDLRETGEKVPPSPPRCMLERKRMGIAAFDGRGGDFSIFPSC